MELEQFNKHFMKNTRKKTPQGKTLEFFLLDTLKTTFRMENLTQRWIQSAPFFPKSGHFSRFSKKELSPRPLSCTSGSREFKICCLFLEPKNADELHLTDKSEIISRGEMST